MERSRFIELIRKKESGEISLLEQRELNDALEQNEWYADVLETLKIVSDDVVFNKTSEDQAAGEIKKLRARIKQAEDNNNRGSVRKMTRVWLAAASIIAIVAVGYLVYSSTTKVTAPAEAANIVSTGEGSKTRLTLPDGSKVWVNAGSKLTYDHSFGIKTRSVFLTGEAYFEVAKDKAHPFIVHTSLMDIRAVGTAFNVRSYANEKSAEATLLEGSVEVEFKRKTGEKIILKPMEKVIVKNAGGESAEIKENDLPEIAVVKVRYDSLAAVPTTRETQWMQDKLVFKQVKFGIIIKELEQYYNTRIIVRDSSLLNRRLSGVFQNETLAEVLETFKLAAGLKYKTEDSVVIIFK